MRDTVFVEHIAEQVADFEGRWQALTRHHAQVA
jgi:hypothetical protein